jgi:hypothetical protein
MKPAIIQTDRGALTADVIASELMYRSFAANRRIGMQVEQYARFFPESDCRWLRAPLSGRARPGAHRRRLRVSVLRRARLPLHLPGVRAMNARHEVNLFDEADEIAPHDEREFREWSSLVSAESTLRRAIEERNPLAITYARAAREPREQRADAPAQPRRCRPDGSDPF